MRCREGFTTKTKAMLKKGGPTGGIIGLILAGGFLGGGLLSPGIALVQLKETMLKDLNDQFGAQSIRSNHILKAKLNKSKAGLGVCGSKVQIRCKFGSMSSREIERFKKAGFEVESDKVGTGLLGREKITSLTSPSGKVINNPADLLNSKDVEINSAVRRAYNPKFMGFSDKVANKVFGSLGTSKAAAVKGSTDEDRDKNFTEDTKNGQNLTADGSRKVESDKDGNYVKDDDGTIIREGSPDYEKVRNKPIGDTAPLTEKIKESSKLTTGNTTKSLLKSGAKGLSLLGAADSACTVYNTARLVAAAAKTTRALQLARFAMIFLATADKIKAGNATPEEVEYLGKNLNTLDTQKKISDETTVEKVENNVVVASEKDNPNYNKNAFDSPGYKVAAYGDQPVLSTRSQQYMVGGGLVGTLSGIIGTVNSVIGGDPKTKCKVIQSWWARGAGLIGGIIAGVGSFGASTAVVGAASIAIAIGGSVSSRS